MKPIVVAILLCVCAALPLAAQTAPPEGMVQIPAGEFWMGRDHSTEMEASNKMPRGWRDDRPANLIQLDAFYLDKYEVSNADYAKFLQANNGKAPWHWVQGKIPAGEEKVPIFNVNWFEADAYCKWVGKRLPTEAEWEKAARGGAESKRYPWGDRLDRNMANFLADPMMKTSNGTTPCRSYPQNGFGLFDMAGNVWEWVSDWYDPQYYQTSPARNPIGPPPTVLRLLRGGSWLAADVRMLSCSHRHKVPPDTYSYAIGFRVACSVP